MKFKEYEQMMSEKYGEDFPRDQMTEEEERKWIELVSEYYIETGTKRDRIRSTDDIYDGEEFEIIRGATPEDGFDLEALPFFLVRVCGDECFYYPNELFHDA